MTFGLHFTRTVSTQVARLATIRKQAAQWLYGHAPGRAFFNSVVSVFMTFLYDNNTMEHDYPGNFLDSNTDLHRK